MCTPIKDAVDILMWDLFSGYLFYMICDIIRRKRKVWNRSNFSQNYDFHVDRAKERIMKVQVIYSSLTGCTKKVANAIYNGIDAEQKTIHDLKDGAPVLDGDIILCGYWGISGNPNDEMKAFLKTIKGKAVGIFCTLGYYADSAHGRQTLEAGLNLVKENNEVIGGFVCNGAVAQNLKDGQGKSGVHTPTEQKELRWEMVQNHPTNAECALAAERFNERIKLYTRCKELKIEFTSIL